MRTSDGNVVVRDFLFVAFNCALNFIIRKAMMRRHGFVILRSVSFKKKLVHIGFASVIYFLRKMPPEYKKYGSIENMVH